MSRKEVLELPISFFWLLHKLIDHLRAEDDVRSMQVTASAQSGESFAKTMESLQARLGEVVIIDRTHLVMQERFDRSGFNELKAMGV